MRKVFALSVILVLVVLLFTAAAPASAGGEGYHCVRRGETLTQIACKYHTTPYAIAVANGLANPNLIYAGQVLVIPGGYGNAGYGKAVVAKPGYGYAGYGKAVVAKPGYGYDGYGKGYERPAPPKPVYSKKPVYQKPVYGYPEYGYGYPCYGKAVYAKSVYGSCGCGGYYGCGAPKMTPYGY